MTRKYKFLPILVLSIIMIISVLSAFNIVNAGSAFGEHSTNWDDIENSINASRSDYPYNGDISTGYTEEQLSHIPGGEVDKIKKGKIKSVSSYITYGVKKNLVIYYGELPYTEIRKNVGTDDEKYISGFSKYFSLEGTTMSGDNPDFDGGTVTAEEYWGTTHGEFSNLKEAEDINKDSIVSLRLYALQHTLSGWLDKIGYFFGNILYVICRGIAYIATVLVSLVVRAKNICMKFILDTLHLPDLVDIINKAFVIDKDTGQISFFMAICICFLIFEIVAFAINYAKGGSKNKSLLNIVITALIGFGLVGFGLSGRIQDIGTSLSNLVSKVMYVASESMQDTNGGTFFKFDVDDKDNESEVITMSELSLVYKPFMDIQIATQFGVNTIDELKFSNYGDSDCTNAQDILVSGLGTADKFKTNFNGNLGYYYWFANSSASEKKDNNIDLPGTSASAAENKLNSMITYLQKQYNNGNDKVKSLIKNNIEGLAYPKPGLHFLNMLTLAAIIILLGLVLAKYAVNVIISKVCLFVALLGFGPAGIMVLSNKDKWVKTGKQIVQMVLISFIEITVWSVFFDLILYVVAFLLADDLMRLILILALLLLFWKFNYTIAEVIKRSLDNATRAMCPEYHAARASAKSFMYKGKDKIREFNDQEVIVGQDENGDNIYRKRGETKIGKALTYGANALLTNGNDHKTFYGLHKKEQAESAKYHNDQRKATAKKAEENVKELEDQLDSIENKVNNAMKSVDTIAVDSYDSANDTYRIPVIDEKVKQKFPNLTEAENEMKRLNNDRNDLVKNIRDQKSDLDKLNSKYKEGEARSEEDEKQAKLLEENIDTLQNRLNQTTEKLTKLITTSTLKQELRKIQIDDDKSKVKNTQLIEDLVDNIDSNSEVDTDLVKSTILNAEFNSRKDELVHNLNTVKNATSDYTRSERNRKIGKKKKDSVNINKEYIEKESLAELKLRAIAEAEKSDNYVSKDDRTNINTKAKTITENVIRDKYKVNIDNKASHLKEQYKENVIFTEKWNEGRKAYKEEKAKVKETQKELNDNSNISRAGAKAHKHFYKIRHSSTNDLMNFHMDHDELNISRDDIYKSLNNNDSEDKIIRDNRRAKMPWNKDTLEKEIEKSTNSAEAANRKKEQNDNIIKEAVKVKEKKDSSKTDRVVANKTIKIAVKNAKPIDKVAKKETKRQRNALEKEKDLEISRLRNIQATSTNIEDQRNAELNISRLIKEKENLHKKGNLPTENQKIESSINDMELERFNPEMNNLLNKNLDDDLNYFEKLGKDTDSNNDSNNGSNE